MAPGGGEAMFDLPLVVLALVATLVTWVQVVSRVVAPRIHVDLACSKTSIAYGTTTELAVTVRNPTRFPCPFLKCTIPLPDGLSVIAQAKAPTSNPREGKPSSATPDAEEVRPNESATTSLILSVGPLESVTVRFRVKGLRRGRHPVQRVSLDVSDGFTMKSVTKSFAFFVIITVHPRRIDAKRSETALNQWGPRTSPTKLSPTSVDWVDMRPYAMGDSFRDIAWMPSARRGELIVLERSSTMNQQAVLIVSVRSSEWLWASNGAFADQVYETTFALVEALSRQGVHLLLFCDARQPSAKTSRDRHLVFQEDGIWTPRLAERVGHRLGSMPASPSVSLGEILADVERRVSSPTKIVVLLGYEDSAIRHHVNALARRGHSVDVIKLTPSTAPTNQGEVNLP